MTIDFYMIPDVIALMYPPLYKPELWYERYPVTLDIVEFPEMSHIFADSPLKIDDLSL